MTPVQVSFINALFKVIIGAREVDLSDDGDDNEEKKISLTDKLKNSHSSALHKKNILIKKFEEIQSSSIDEQLKSKS
jgi:hypothetical protein